MDHPVDSCCIINIEHAYAVAGNLNYLPVQIKNEVVDVLSEDADGVEMQCIKTEELSIKSETPDYMEYCDTIVSTSELQIDVKEEETDPLAINFDSREHLGSDENKYNFPENVSQEQFHIEYNKSPLIQLTQKDNSYTENGLFKLELKKLQNTYVAKLNSLVARNILLESQNRILKEQLNTTLKPLQKKIVSLSDQNRKLQKDLEEFEEIKRGYRLLEDQLVTVTLKMYNFMSETLPSLMLEHSTRVGQLKTQLESSKNETKVIDERIQNVVQCLTGLKSTIHEVSNTGKSNLLRATARANDLEFKLKAVMEQNVNLNVSLKSFGNSCARQTRETLNENKQLQQKYRDQKIRFKNSVMQRELYQRAVQKLDKKLRLFTQTVVNYQKTIQKLSDSNKELVGEIEAQKNRPCKYCGF